MDTPYPSLRALAVANEKMSDLFRWLDSRGPVTSARRGMDARIFRDAITIEQYVEGDLVNGRGICFWLETRAQGDTCAVDADVFMQTPDGQITIRHVSAEVASEADLETTLGTAAEALWKSREQDIDRVLDPGSS